MQQMDALRKRLNPGNEWVRIGIASATIMAPLLKRWTDLRDADSTRALREEAEVRWNGARSRFALNNRLQARRQPLAVVTTATKNVRQRNNNAARIWLIGVGVGLVAAGAGAYFLVQRRMNQSLDEPLVDLPVASSNGHGANAGTARAASPSLAAASATQTEAPAATGVNGMSASALTPTPSAERTGGAQSAPQTARPAAGEPGELSNGAGTVTESGAPAGVVDASAAPFIGNIRTMVYHERDDENLPAEENRIYFASEDEAHEAGYRRDREDVPAADSEAAEAGGTGI